MVTREVSTLGEPLLTSNGRPMKNIRITFMLVDTTNKRTDVFDRFTGERVTGITEVKTDSTGNFSVDLFPTTRANKPVAYLVHVHNTAIVDFYSELQEGNNTISWLDFMAYGRPPNPQEKILIQAYLDTLVNDSETVPNKTWSSQKIQQQFDTFAPQQYTHDQQVSSDVWDVTHNMNRYPVVVVIDSSGSVVTGEVTYITNNRVKIEFSAPFGGKAYFS
jgi:hypothetical protein